MLSATKFVVAGAIVALFGGFLLSSVLTQPSVEQMPAVGASAPATAQPEAIGAATSEPKPTTGAGFGDTATPDLLPGVDLATEEIEPGVYRVASDGVRDLVRLPDQKDHDGGSLDGNVVAGLDGSVWWFGPDGFHRLGEVAMHRWPKGISGSFRPGQADIEVGPDGTVWLTAWCGVPGKDARVSIASYDGETWSRRWRGAMNRRYAHRVEIQQDGTVWMAWSRYGKNGDTLPASVRVARLLEDGWQTFPGSMEGGPPRVTVPKGSGSDIWLMSGLLGQHRLHRHDGDGWAIQPTPDTGADMRADVGPDGTLWVRLKAGCDICWGGSDVLARFDGGGWEVYDSADGIPMMGEPGSENVFSVAPDRSIWFNPNGDYERTSMGCGGIANFDGEAVTYLLRDTCIYAMDLAPDGTVWLQAGVQRGDAGDGPRKARPRAIHTYVITAHGLAAPE